jgi:hypothetical protein
MVQIYSYVGVSQHLGVHQVSHSRILPVTEAVVRDNGTSEAVIDR